MFGTQIALVSLVDATRQWFKSTQGLDATETHRDISFCGHAILGQEVFVISDASRDERFHDNPLVTGAPNIRFYAGCPLRSKDGSNIGTLCVIDEQPRQFTEDDADALRDLAAMVEAELSSFQSATTDELTGISNRRGFVHLANCGLAYAAARKLPSTLAFIDLDKFKPINDTFGHAEGDRALKTFASSLIRCFRATDVIGRIGGDEFAVLMLGEATQNGVTLMMALSDHLDKVNATEQRGYDLEFSYGMSEFNTASCHDIERLLSDGDVLMYQHKKSKREAKPDAA
jgi:diguanylate cyclase (GGDEF)-like protein